MPEPSMNMHDQSPEHANYETAIKATGFGKFNLLLILVLIPASLANSVESSTMSFVVPVAECDLGLTLEDKGLLNAITYLGMITSAFLWGFLFDIFGRQKLISIGFFLDFICVLTSAFSQNKTMLLTTKFFGGFVINGPYAAVSTYVSEFHADKYRGRMQLTIAFLFGCSGIVLTWIAYGILSKIDIPPNILNFHSWNLFLAVWSIPPLLGSIAFYFLPESPRYLMTAGETDKALSLCQWLYAKNTGQALTNYPIKKLVDDGIYKRSNKNAKESFIIAIKNGWQQIKPLFLLPFLPNIILICVIQTFFTMNINTVRLWLPQIFQAFNDVSTNASDTGICDAFQDMQPTNMSANCSFNTDNVSVYFNSTIVNLVVIITQLCAAYFINIIQKKKILLFVGLAAGICAYSLYFITNTELTMALVAIYISLSGTVSNVAIVVNLETFPTTLRTVSLALALMCGRIGSMIGNLIFPLLIQAGCAPPLFTIGSVIIVGAILSLLLPNTDHKNLE